jgi:hypothetical protein
MFLGRVVCLRLEGNKMKQASLWVCTASQLGRGDAPVLGTSSMAPFPKRTLPKEIPPKGQEPQVSSGETYTDCMHVFYIYIYIYKTPPQKIISWCLMYYLQFFKGTML